MVVAYGNVRVCAYSHLAMKKCVKECRTDFGSAVFEFLGFTVLRKLGFSVSWQWIP